MSETPHSPAPDGGTEVGTDELTGGSGAASGADTVRESLDHAGNPRPGGTTNDAGATTAAARELDTEDDDEPTRSE
ncbi:hypothetical protein [Pseudonocardia phyllosphaerae]|uniref:hypothetical protein n=1 Tax=Pseudonocardia phyllosphaerae TaxID=3390502 RepID=UPI00397AFA95